MTGIARLVTLIGVGVLFLSLFVLPWVIIPDQAQVESQMDDLLRKVGLQNALEKLPAEVLGGRVTRPFGARELRARLTRPELQRLFAAAEREQTLTAWRIWRDELPLKDGLRSGLMIAAFAGALGLLGIALSYLPSGGILGGFLGLLSVPPIALLLWFLPSVQTFGQHDDFQLALACVLLDTRTGPGPYLALLGLMAIIAGTVFTYLALCVEESRRTIAADTWG